ncbi:LOW QUALITY PROTEIN: hypothetical protein NC652_028859 [Populus alba x Populus x berolinensis]|nr:LOW QUALITY PROTEIN: hypothetical protein NC652_028859 [Populus alba x Populus x berolinensis]
MFLQEPVLYVASADLRCLVLFAELRKPDSNREASKKALEHKKEITKHLGRPFIQTNPYEAGVEVDIAIRDVGGLLEQGLGRSGCSDVDRCFNRCLGYEGVIACAKWDGIKFPVLLLGLWVDEKFKFLCDNGDGGHEIKIAMRDLGGLDEDYKGKTSIASCVTDLTEALKFMVGLMVYQYAAFVYFYFSIGQLESIKQALYELVILPLRKPELFSHEKLLGPQKGVLLYGPPGTRKSMLAKAIIREFGAVFINMRISNLMSKWFGDALELPHVTPSHKQQSVPSFHVSVLGCWQFHEAKLLMEKDSLNWSKERLWS